MTVGAALAVTVLLGAAAWWEGLRLPLEDAVAVAVAAGQVAAQCPAAQPCAPCPAPKPAVCPRTRRPSPPPFPAAAVAWAFLGGLLVGAGLATCAAVRLSAPRATPHEAAPLAARHGAPGKFDIGGDWNDERFALPDVVAPRRQRN